MINNPQISIVVPVYQAERYIARCIDSILSQSFSDWELLLINDGSTDASGLICDNYAAIDERIRVIHKHNEGVSQTRQLGHDLAGGTFTIHVDPDDWIEQDMLSTLYETAMSENADMVICDFYWDKDNVSRVVSQRPSSLVTSDVLTDLFRHLHGNCWNKLIRRETYRKYDVKYVPKITFCEDLLFNVELLTNPVKVAYVSKAFYHYVQCENENSLSRTYTYETLAKDTHLKSLVMKLTRGLICEKESEYFMDSMIVKRAFFSALFSSSAFKTAFYSFRKSVIISKSNSFLVRIILYCACIGLYKPIYKIIRLIR